MSGRLRSSVCGYLAVAVFTAALAIPNRCFAQQGFPPISPDELKMTSEPQAPGAPAIILFREVDRDDNLRTSHEDDYIRIKILTEEGRKYGDVEIEFNKASETISNISARTIKPDGSEVRFDGKVYEKTVEKARGWKFLAKTFTLPNVEVGSIIEYRWTYDFAENYIFNSQWILSSDLFTRYARFTLKPYSGSYVPIRMRLTWQGLPQGSEPKQGPDRIVRMEVHNMAAFQAEDYMPPPVDADYSFASYHAKTEVNGGVIRYTRTFEVKELSVPVEHADELKRFYRTISGDERNTVVLKALAK
jgi:hypothetical protein